MKITKKQLKRIVKEAVDPMFVRRFEVKLLTDRGVQFLGEFTDIEDAKELAMETAGDLLSRGEGGRIHIDTLDGDGARVATIRPVPTRFVFTRVDT